MRKIINENVQTVVPRTRYNVVYLGIDRYTLLRSVCFPFFLFPIVFPQRETTRPLAIPSDEDIFGCTESQGEVTGVRTFSSAGDRKGGFEGQHDWIRVSLVHGYHLR